MATDLVTLKPGRPKVPKNSLEEVLNRYVHYDTTLRSGPHRQAHRPRGPFLELMGRSDQWLRNYLKHQHLTWDTLDAATDDRLLFFVTFGQRPYDVTWANPAVHHALGYAFDEHYESLDGRKVFAGYTSELLSGKSAIDVMRGGRRLSESVRAEIEKVHADPSYVGHIERTYLVRCTDGWRVPVEIVELRFTNEWIDRWVTIARIIGEAHPKVRELHGHADGRATTSGELSKDESMFNVDDRAVLKLTAHNPQGLILNGADHVVIGGIPMTPPLLLQPAPSITTLNLTPRLTDQEMRDLYERWLPPYQYPRPDDDKKDDAG